jgi:hypothetical protein
MSLLRRLGIAAGCLVTLHLGLCLYMGFGPPSR